jgi:predicted nucleotidyltransferase
MKLEIDQQQLRAFCRNRGISRLELFGSGLGPNFQLESDIDLLATFRSDTKPTLLEWAAMQEELESILGRRVDLVSRRAVESSRNPYRRNSILSSAQCIYAEG